MGWRSDTGEGREGRKAGWDEEPGTGVQLGGNLCQAHEKPLSKGCLPEEPDIG